MPQVKSYPSATPFSFTAASSCFFSALSTLVRSPRAAPPSSIFSHTAASAQGLLDASSPLPLSIMSTRMASAVVVPAPRCALIMRSLWCRGRTIPWPALDPGPVTAAPIPLGRMRTPTRMEPASNRAASFRASKASPSASVRRASLSSGVSSPCSPFASPSSAASRHRSRHVQRRENSRRHVPPDTGRPLCSISETYNLDSRASWYVTGFHQSWSESLCMSLSALHVHATDAESRVEQNRTIWNAKSKFRADVRPVTSSLVSGPSPAVDGAFPISAAPLAVDGVRSCGGVECWAGQREGNRNDVVIDFRLTFHGANFLR